jgi:hypothetical protein
LFAAEATILGIDGGLLKAIALVVCFAIFVSIALWLVFSRSSSFRRTAQLPLEDEDVGEAADASDHRGTHKSGSSRDD